MNNSGMHSDDYIALGGLAFVATSLGSIKIYARTKIARVRREKDSRPLPDMHLPAIPEVRDGPERPGDVSQLLFEYETTVRVVGNMVRQLNAETSAVRKEGLAKLANQSNAQMQRFRSMVLNELMRGPEVAQAASETGVGPE